MTGGRATALLVGLPFALAAAGWGGFQMVGLFAQATEHHATSYAWSGGDISVSTSSGHVHVAAGDVSVVEVSYTERYQLKKPVISAADSGSGLQLTAKCAGGLWGNNCDIDYDVTVPASAHLVVHTGDGGVSISGVTGGVSVSTGDGGISLDHVGGAVVAHTGDGGISATRLGSAPVKATTGDGGIALAWLAPPTDVTVETGDGGIELTLPADSGPYAVSVSTGDGRTHVTVPTDASASSKVSARTGDGSITVEPATATG